jgi:hypothetical protein
VVRWYTEGYMTVDGRVFDVGNTTAQAIRTIRNGTPALEAGPADEYALGNGWLMRVLLLALWSHGRDDELIAPNWLSDVVIGIHHLHLWWLVYAPPVAGLTRLRYRTFSCFW